MGGRGQIRQNQRFVGKNSLAHLVQKFEVFQSDISRHLCLCLSLLADDHFCRLTMVRGLLLVDEMCIGGYVMRCLLLLSLVPTWSIVQEVSALTNVSSISLSGHLVVFSVSYEI